MKEKKDIKIYVASSWRNELQPAIIQILLNHGYAVYDFRNPPDKGAVFHWSQIDINWNKWTSSDVAEALNHPLAKRGFKSDFEAMEWADIFIGIQPFGKSASLEMGWAVGNGKHTILLLNDSEPELMIKMIDKICCNTGEMLTEIEKYRLNSNE